MDFIKQSALCVCLALTTIALPLAGMSTSQQDRQKQEQLFFEAIQKGNEKFMGGSKLFELNN